MKPKSTGKAKAKISGKDQPSEKGQLAVIRPSIPAKLRVSKADKPLLELMLELPTKEQRDLFCVLAGRFFFGDDARPPSEIDPYMPATYAVSHFMLYPEPKPSDPAYKDHVHVLNLRPLTIGWLTVAKQVAKLVNLINVRELNGQQQEPGSQTLNRLMSYLEKGYEVASQRQLYETAFQDEEPSEETGHGKSMPRQEQERADAAQTKRTRDGKVNLTAFVAPTLREAVNGIAKKSGISTQDLLLAITKSFVQNVDAHKDFLDALAKEAAERATHSVRPLKTPSQKLALHRHSR